MRCSSPVTMANGNIVPSQSCGSSRNVHPAIVARLTLTDSTSRWRMTCRPGNHLVCYGSVAQQVNRLLGAFLEPVLSDTHRIDDQPPRHGVRGGKVAQVSIRPFVLEFILAQVVFVKQPFGVGEISAPALGSIVMLSSSRMRSIKMCCSRHHRSRSRCRRAMLRIPQMTADSNACVVGIRRAADVLDVADQSLVDFSNLSITIFSRIDFDARLVLSRIADDLASKHGQSG